MDLKFAQKILLVNFWLVLGFTLAMVVVYELNIFYPSSLGGDENLVFFLQVVMEMITIAVIPVALKLFAFKKVRAKLVREKGAALLPLGTARLNMLCLPMLVNTFLYYQVYSPTFGYMAIILFLCLFFIYPSMGRCHQETEYE